MLKFCLPKFGTGMLLTAISSRLSSPSYASFNVPPIQTKIQPAPPIKPLTFMAKNKALQRPLSPHLSIYKPQMSSMMSISLRMTGIALGVMAWVVCLTKLLTDLSVEDVVSALKSLEFDDCYWTAAKTVAIFPFAFHFVAGIRHLLFDTAKLLERTEFFATGCLALVSAFALTLVLGMMEDIRERYDEIQYQKQLEKKKEG